MERQTSVDDLLGGFWRLGQAGMGRTDSEAAFQEFLKRIPSTTNLAAAVAESQGASQPAATSVLPAGVLTDVTAAAASGIPRVPSLELLRQLVQFPSSSAAPPALSAPVVKTEAPPPTSSTFRLPETVDSVLKAASAVPALSATVALPAALPLPSGYPLAGIPALTDLASLSAVGAAALHGVPGFAPPGNPLSAALTPAAAAAAALQLGQLGTIGARHLVAQHTTSAASGGNSDRDCDGRVDSRRARRMLSNRESARRSRRRKQEHLSKLEEERNSLEDERREIENNMSSLERRSQSLEEENKRLKEENERLRDELRFLRTEIADRKDRNGYGHYGGRGRPHAESDDEQPAKRHRHSDKSSSEEHPGNGCSDPEAVEKRPRGSAAAAAAANGAHGTKHGLAAANGRSAPGSGNRVERSGERSGGERTRQDGGKPAREQRGRERDREARDMHEEEEDA